MAETYETVNDLESIVRTNTECDLNNHLSSILNKHTNVYLYPPIECIDIYGNLEYYLYVFYKGDKEPMEFERMETMGERLGRRVKVGYDYPNDYGFVIMLANINTHASYSQYFIPPMFYNYSLSEKEACKLLGVEVVRLLGYVYKFKYPGLLFEGNERRVLVNPAQFYFPDGAFGGRLWKYYMWEDIEPHLEEWDIGSNKIQPNSDYSIPNELFPLKTGKGLNTKADWFTYAS